MSKFNSFEILTQSAQKKERKNILNAKIVKECYSFWDTKAIFAHFALQLHSAMLVKSWNFFSELPNPRSY